MKFVRSINELQINNLCRNEDCFCETVFVPEDIKFQIRLPDQTEKDYTVDVKVFDAEFDEIEDLVYEYLIAVDNNGERYINIIAKNFPSIPCFYLKVTVENDDVVVFSKYTEQWCVKEADVQCVAVFTEKVFKIYIGGVEQTELTKEFIDGLWVVYLPSCDSVVTSDESFHIKKIISPASSCGLSYKKIESFYNCFDIITGEFFGDYAEYIAGNALLKYNKSSWLPLKIEKAPSDLRISYLSKQNRATKSEITPLYDIRCLIPLPEWKATEFEEHFLAKEIYVDSNQYVFTGGQVIEKDTINCSCSYIARARVQTSVKQNMFACEDLCTRFCSYFVINTGEKDQPYYNENGSFIGSVFSSLISYLESLQGIINVEEYISPYLACYPVAIIKINHTGYIPSYIYAGNRFSTSRVFSKRDNCINPATLCDSVPSCPPSIITTGEPYEDGCPAVTYTLGTAYEGGTGDAVICGLTVLDTWTDDGSSSSIIGSTVTLILKVTGAPDNYFNQPIARIGGGNCGEFDPGDFDSSEFDAGCEVSCRPCSSQFVNLGDGSSVIIQPDGYILFTGVTAPSGIIDYTITYNKNC